MKILIVEEDAQVSAAMAKALSGRGYRIRIETNGAAALLAAHDDLPECILLDLMMPILEGLETIHALRHDARTAHIPIIALASALQDTDQAVANAMASGANIYLMKPPDPQALQAAVERLVTLRPTSTSP